MKKYHYYNNCVGWNYLDVDAEGGLNDMIDESIDITRRTFLKHVAKDELREIERVVKPNGRAVHIMRTGGEDSESPVHQRLISSDWNYDFSKTQDAEGLKYKYVKIIQE